MYTDVRKLKHRQLKHFAIQMEISICFQQVPAISPFEFLRDSFHGGRGDPVDVNFSENYCSSKNLESTMFAKIVIRSHLML